MSAGATWADSTRRKVVCGQEKSFFSMEVPFQRMSKHKPLFAVRLCKLSTRSQQLSVCFLSPNLLNHLILTSKIFPIGLNHADTLR